MEAETFVARVRENLKSAMRERHGDEIALLRTLIAAVDNAQAVVVSPDHHPYIPHAFGSGTNEVPRRLLTAQDINALVAKEIAAREDAAMSYRAGGCEEAATILDSEIALLQTYL